MAFSLRSPLVGGTAEQAAQGKGAGVRQLHRCGARHAAAPPRQCVVTRATGQPRKGVQAASATSQQQRSSSSSTEPAAGQPPAAAPSQPPAAPVSGGRPLLNGGNAVEEEALASALRTVQLHASGQLGSRRLRFDCGNVLDSSYARCGEVTEDYGRTFYMGALAAAPRAAGDRRHWAPQRPKKRRARLGRAAPPAYSLTRPPCAPSSHPADDGEAAEGYLGNLRCAGGTKAGPASPAGRPR